MASTPACGDESFRRVADFALAHLRRRASDVVDLGHNLGPIALRGTGQATEARKMVVVRIARLFGAAPPGQIHAHVPGDDQAHTACGKLFVDGEDLVDEDAVGRGAILACGGADETVLQGEGSNRVRGEQVDHSHGLLPFSDTG